MKIIAPCIYILKVCLPTVFEYILLLCISPYKKHFDDKKRYIIVRGVTLFTKIFDFGCKMLKDFLFSIFGTCELCETLCFATQRS